MDRRPINIIVICLMLALTVGIEFGYALRWLVNLLGLLAGVTIVLLLTSGNSARRWRWPA